MIFSPFTVKQIKIIFEFLCDLLHLRLSILESIIANLNALDDCNGLQAIPLIQVILMLSTDLNGSNERDQRILNDLLTGLVTYVGMDSNANASKASSHKFNKFQFNRTN